MTDDDRAILDLAGAWYRQEGARVQAIARLGMTPTRFWQRVNQLLDVPVAAVEYPVVVARLRRLRSERTRLRHNTAA